MTEPLFDLEPPETEPHSCEHCSTTVEGTADGLRCAGWIVFDGLSVVGEVLNVRICPTCQRSRR